MTRDQVRQLAVELAEQAIESLASGRGGAWVLAPELSSDDVDAVRGELHAIAESVATDSQYSACRDCAKQEAS